MPVHPVCDLFPLMDDISLAKLADDIREHGLHVPIVIHNGQLVDGRNRVIACQQAKVQPFSVEWRDICHGEQSIVRWIWAINAERRHLTNDQYVAIAIELCAYEEREAAKIRQIAAASSQGAHGKEGGRGHTKPSAADSSQRVSKPAREPAVRAQIAQQFGVSEYKTQQALNVQKAQQELLKKVIQGKLSLREAIKRVTPVSPHLVKLANHDYNRASNIRAIVEAMRTLARAFYTAEELAAWHVDEPFCDDFDTLLLDVETYCDGMRMEIQKERDRRKPRIVSKKH